MLTPVIAELAETPSEAEISEAVRKIAELFRALDSPSKASLQGIWCELLLIYRSNRIRQVARAWHSAPEALYDFVSGRQCVEVKSCTGPHRVHHFSLDQVSAEGAGDVLVASLIVEDSGRGLSIVDLWEWISQRKELSPQLRHRLDQILALSLGRDWREANRVLFDPEQVWKSLRIYDVADVPRVGGEIPIEVSEVRFRSDLTDAIHIPLRQVSRRGALFNALFDKP